MFRPIVTVSLCPAIDSTIYIDHLTSNLPNIVLNEIKESAGKGINLSRALKNLGIDTIPVVLLGKENMEAYLKGLEHDDFELETIVNSGATRENITIATNDSEFYKLDRSGFVADEDAITGVNRVLRRYSLRNALIVFSGRLPDGVSFEDFAVLCKTADAGNAKIAIDSASLTLEQIISLKPWLIKPNLDEFCKLTGRTAMSELDIAKKSHEIMRLGVENVAVSLGERGLVFSCASGSYLAVVPKVEVRSPVGAGDCALAGFVYAAQNAFKGDEACRLAAALGTAKCMVPGSAPPKSSDLQAVIPHVSVTKLL